MEQLKSELRKKDFKRLYLIHGDERFLMAHYALEITKAMKELAIPDTFEDVSPVADIIMTADSLPFFGERRLIYVRNSKLFTTGRKSDSEAMAEYLPKIPQETTIVFVESEIDKRSRLYKKANEIGFIIDCKSLTGQALSKWVSYLAKQRSKTIDQTTINKLFQVVGTNMATINQEMEKLFHYSGKNTNITPADIDEICTPTLEARIFELTKALATGKATEALAHYRNMQILKEPPIKILTMIIRQFRIMLIAKEGIITRTPSQISKEFGIHEFSVNEAVGQSRRFTTEKLISILYKCQDVDTRIKSGLIDAELGVEMLIIQLLF